MKATITDFGRTAALWQSTPDAPGALVFCPANGFPVASYRQFFGYLETDWQVFGLENRGMWPAQPAPANDFDWRDHADDLIAFIEYLGREQGLALPVTGVGHSIGATVTLLAAIKRPDLFSQLVLIDPASQEHSEEDGADNPRESSGLKAQLVEKTLKRRHLWRSHGEFADYLAGKGAYSAFTRQALEDYAAAGLIPEGGVLTLAYSRDWESHNFATTPAAWSLFEQIPVPSLFVYGEHSPMYPGERIPQLLGMLPGWIDSHRVDGAGHLLIQEAPSPVADAVLSWLEAGLVPGSKSDVV